MQKAAGQGAIEPSCGSAARTLGQDAIESCCGSYSSSQRPTRLRRVVHSSYDRRVGRVLHSHRGASRTTAGACRGQGATEYLVLLAVVLVIALVAIALLGFFPGTASDAQVAESQIYWQSASPIAIVEWAAEDAGAWAAPPSDITYPYLRIRNTGSYPVRITKILGDGGQSRYQVVISGLSNMSDYYYLAPGEEKYFANNGRYTPLPANRDFAFGRLGGPRTDTLNSASQMCEPASSATRGTVVVKDFGFEYIQYIESQQLTKRQVGTRPLMIKCRG